MTHVMLSNCRPFHQTSGCATCVPPSKATPSHLPGQWLPLGTGASFAKNAKNNMDHVIIAVVF